MVGLQPSLYTIAFALCVFSTGILSGRRTREGKLTLFFVSYLAIESLGFALELLVAHPAVPMKSIWLGLLMSTSLLTAPCLWLAIRETVVGERPRLGQLGVGHWVVIAMGALLTVPLMFTSHLGPGWVSPALDARAWHYAYIHEAMIGCVVIFGLQVPYYLYASRRLLLAQQRDSHSASLSSRAWLHLPLLMVGTTWLMGMARTMQCAFHAPADLAFWFALTDVSMTVGAMFLIIKRASRAEPAPSKDDAGDIPSEATPAGPDSKYVKSRLDEVHRARIRRKLKTAMVAETQYVDSMLNLRSLSHSLKEKPHYVSQVINQDLGTNFYELVNRHRITRAQALLRDGSDQTVLEIALAVGFNSKSTFNTAFKRFTGMTPREYRAQKFE